ncbi:alpha/beta hydrolase [Cellulomonas sp. SG140]|uniref:alpha/beta hydrolase n=1 Tax=Cellulomonas sp. SG140 TaxID=2976536 RepID=UPI0021E85A65|nr:alpha/beta hydrolase [Cellulomonas sp. SG140]
MTLHPQARALLEQLPPSGPPDLSTVDDDRAAARSAALAQPDRAPIEHVADLDADGVPVRLYRPRRGAPIALYVHGGGWMFHDLETHDAFCRYLADATGWALLAVDYRRAPEHPYPAPLDDVQTAARWLRSRGAEHDVDASWLPGIGDSSGANLLAGLTVREPSALDFQVLMYPPTDRRWRLDPAADTAALTGAEMDWFWEHYAPGSLGDNPDVSVLRAPNLSQVPPALVVTAEHDPLAAQGRAYATALAEAGAEVVGFETFGQIHSFWRQPAAMDASRALVPMVGALLDSHRARARTR